MTRALNPTVEQFNHDMLRGLSESEQQLFLKNLQRIIANITAVFEGAGDRFSLLPGKLDFEEKEGLL